VIFEVFAMVKLEFMVFWVAAPCSKYGGWIPTLKMEATQSPETLAFSHHSTWYNNPENYEFYSISSFYHVCSVPRM
jgi:hypothetical protein